MSPPTSRFAGHCCAVLFLALAMVGIVTANDALSASIEELPSPVDELVWWQDPITRPLRDSATPKEITVSTLVESAIRHSSRIRVVSDIPLIRSTVIAEALGTFDWTAFLETNWNDLDEPVGSILTTGGPPRFLDNAFDFDSGVRKQNKYGGKFQLDQAYGTEKSNSVFFIPNPQGTARFSLSYSQPILRGGGRAYNTSLILVADLETCASRDEFQAELQDHLAEVSRAYWALYLERGALLQRHRLYCRGQQVLQQLQYRQDIDVVQNQIVRSEAAVAARKSDLYRAAASVKNAEARIRALVNDPEYGCLDEVELTPVELPQAERPNFNIVQSVQIAMQNRPEVQNSIKQIRAAGVRMNVAKNEMLPLLDVVLATYVAGLRGDRDVGGAYSDQFQNGAPSYSAGIRVEVPIGNRVAKARHERRALELRQLQQQLRVVLAALQLEVEIAAREVEATYREYEARKQALDAAARELDFITRRWEHLAGDDRTASLVLEDMLAAQERLAIQEFSHLSAEVDYNVALIELQRAQGTLLKVERVQQQLVNECGLPSLQLSIEGSTAANSGLDPPALEAMPAASPDGVEQIP